MIAAAKAKKAESLHPYVPGTAEKIVTRVSRGLFQLPSGLYPSIGSVYSGGGFAIGPGLRVFTGDTSYVEARALYSIRQYKLAEVSLVAPSLVRGKGSLRLSGGWLDATQVGYFGVGITTSADDRANYRLKQTYGGVELGLHPAGPIVLGAGAHYEDFALERGTGAFAPVQDVFDAASAPGIDASPTYTHLTASAGLDSRPSAGYTRRGSLVRLDYHAYRDTDETYSFNRIDAEVAQHVPILRENWVLSLHGRVQSTVGDSDTVPYFLLPSLGSGRTLRAYSTGRFRDRHALLLQAEWRWIVNRSGMDMAIFYDAGKVTRRREDLDLRGLKSNVGIGVRFHGPASTPLRIELARGNEGLNLVFAAGASF